MIKAIKKRAQPGDEYMQIVANNHFPSPHKYRTDAIALCPHRTIFTFHWSAARFILY